MPRNTFWKSELDRSRHVEGTQAAIPRPRRWLHFYQKHPIPDVRMATASGAHAIAPNSTSEPKFCSQSHPIPPEEFAVSFSSWVCFEFAEWVGVAAPFCHKNRNFRAHFEVYKDWRSNWRNSVSGDADGFFTAWTWINVTLECNWGAFGWGWRWFLHRAESLFANDGVRGCSSSGFIFEYWCSSSWDWDALWW